MITYICEVAHNDSSKVVTRLEEDLQVKGFWVSNVQSIFPLLADPYFSTDYICINIEEFYKNDTVNAFDIINTLATLISCTVNRPDGVKTKKRKTKLVALIGDSTPIEFIREVSDLVNISYLIPRLGGKFTYDDLKDGLENVLKNGDRLHKKIKILIKAKKKISKEIIAQDEIQLTSRQKQVYDLVTTRGYSNKTIAKTLSITESTVKLHMSAILKKFMVRNRTQLVAFAKKKITISE